MRVKLPKIPNPLHKVPQWIKEAALRGDPNHIKLEMQLQPKQMQLLDLVENSRATWIGYGGSRGGAKSHAARAIMLLRRLRNSGTRGCILRRTYPLVRENHIEKLFEEHPFMRQWYRVGDKELKLPNNSTIAFRFAETTADVQAMIGTEYMDMVVDQAEQFSEKELNVLKSCIRWPGTDQWRCKMVLTFNPGNIGSAFLKRVFYDFRYNERERASDYAFIQAYGWDNWEWAKDSLVEEGLSAKEYYEWDQDRRYDYFIKKSQYGRDLNALPQALRIGWLLGSMDKFAGQYFDIFSPDRHIVRCQPEPWSPRTIGIDWGFAHDAACEWSAQAQGKTLFYREFCAPGRSPRALAQEIVDRTPPDERKQVKKIFLSHDAFASRDERDTIAQQMADVFTSYLLPYPEMATKDVVGRSMLLYTLMQRDQVMIDPCCAKLIETLPMVCRDEDKPEQVVKFDGDDSFDAACHVMTYRLGEAQKPDNLRIMEEANQIADPFARWFFLRKHSQKKKAATITPNVVMPWQKAKPSRYVV